MEGGAVAIEVLRIGQRLVRDDRVTTHVALVARAFGAERICMTEVNPEIKYTLAKVSESWGGSFEVDLIGSWKDELRKKKAAGFRTVHLTMYGQEIGRAAEAISREKDVLILVGAEKVPREAYELADYNVSVGSQPHSEVSALAVLLDRIQGGRQFGRAFEGAQMTIIPDERGKNVASEKQSG